MNGDEVIETLVWFSLFPILYAYIGYPLGIWALGRLRRGQVIPFPDNHEPTVTLLISAHNEEKVIGDKLDNCRDLDYPPGLLQIIVVSDASTDETDAIVRLRKEEGFSLVRLPERLGKVEGINRVVPGARGEILILSDANSHYRRDAIRKLTRHFADPSVGLVSGRLLLVTPLEASAGRKESLYWRYECWVRGLESRLGRVIGATGPIYAFRKEIFEEVPSNMICDLMLPVRIAMKRFRVLYDPDAVCIEDAAAAVVPELRRRVRNASRGTRTLLRLLKEAVASGWWGIGIQLVSHKLFRWLALGFLFGVFLGSAFAGGAMFRWFLVFQSLFYGLAVSGWLLDRLGVQRNPFLGPYFLVAAHAASLLGVFLGLVTRGKPYWTPRNA